MYDVVALGVSQFLRYKKSPSDLSEEELTQIVRFACTAASLSSQKHSVSPAYRNIQK